MLTSSPTATKSFFASSSLKLWLLSMLWYLLSVQPIVVQSVPMGEPQVRNVSLSIGCPEFLSAFYETNVSSQSDTMEPFRAFTITNGSGYAYVSLHFGRLWMPLGTSVLLRGVEDYAHQDFVLNLTEYFPSGQLFTSIFAPPVLARELRIEFYRESGPPAPNSSPSAVSTDVTTTTSNVFTDNSCFGFVVDSYTYVLTDSNNNITPTDEATCAADNTEEAICYYNDTSTREAYLAARTVARLLIRKEDGSSAACTGWLLGAEGHLITNNHCIETDAEAKATTVEFGADASSCSTSCMTWGGCQGTVEAIATDLVHTNADLDYTIVKLQTDVDLPKKYGYLRLKAVEGRVGQEVYIPQHPLYYGKRIAVLDDFGNHITILDTEALGCDAIGYSYNGDTQGGSSGSPVIDALDHGVVALHHCGQFCSNTGIPAVEILSDLKANGLLPSTAVDIGDKTNTDNFPDFVPVESTVTSAALTSQLVFNGEITFTAGSNEISVDQFEFSLASDAEISVDVLSVEISDNGIFYDLNGDCKAQYIDPIIFLFAQGNPTALVTDDDSAPGTGMEDGSVSSRDPFLKTFLKKGDYMVALTSIPATAASVFAGGFFTEQSHPEVYSCVALGTSGSYRIEISSSTPITVTKTPPSVSIATGECQGLLSAICSL